MPHMRRTNTPTVNGQPITIWLSQTTLKWLALQGDVGEVAAGIVEKASIKARTPAEPRTRAWRNPAYETASLPPTPPTSPRKSAAPRSSAKPSVESAAGQAPSLAQDESDTPALRVNVMIQQMRIKPSWKYSRDDDGWLCVLRLNGKQYTGVGGTKKTAKQRCCQSFLDEVRSYAPR